MAVIRECVGLKKETWKSQDGKERIKTTIYALEPSLDEKVVGMLVWSCETYLDVSLKVGDKFKAYFDEMREFRDKNGVVKHYSPLSEIIVVKPQ